MSVKAMDQVFSRWVLDSKFRTQMNENPETALAGYDLTGTEKVKMSRLSRKVRRQSRQNPAKSIIAKSPTLTTKIQYRLPQPGQYFNLN